MDSKRLQTAKKFVDHYAENSNEVLDSLLADSSVYTFLPSRSLDNLKTYDKVGFIALKESLKLVLAGYPLDVIQYIESENSNSRPQFREELKDYEEFSAEQWNYVGEYIFMLTMDETGEKITKAHEFMDSKGTDLKLWPLVTRALGNLQKLK